MERQHLGWMSLLLVGLAASCFAQPPDKDAPIAHGGRGGSTIDTGAGTGMTDSGGAPIAPMGNSICNAPKATELLNARANVISDEAVAPEREVFVSTLVEQFKAQCGACHYEAAQGGFHFTKSDFFLKVDLKAIERMKSDDPTKFMPPPNSGGVPWSSRKNDAVTALAGAVQEWWDAGHKADVYFVKNDVADKQYLFTGELGTQMTNLGSCVPDTEFAFGSSADEMDELDVMFAASEAEPSALDHVVLPEEQLGLPLHLQDTDLKTFDSAVLARNGVVAFVPAYPLWTDGAGKLRHVRVPRGKSIHFDKETQEFDIPENTRFYKTFFKDVIDRDGNPSFRKMETRIIVSRPDEIVDGRRVPRALFGTYQWNDDESEATLVTQAQRNGEPFKDVMVTYTPDEPKAQTIRDRMPPNLTYELEFQGALRHYAIPGKERCIQCHMGSHNQSFVLGFSPLQIRRRKTGEGGTYEPTGEDELSQLERLVAYGVITGLKDEKDIPKLEDIQGERKPRNDYELKAQAYMLGNCAHCHNPNGYPSQAAPELKDLLKFWPDAAGGIFQFPLESYSPRIFRGPDSAPIAYISPSLYDVWPLLYEDKPWTPKVLRENENVSFFKAPWRSLIWRNVQTPFPYSDNLTLYPHMPMNTAGFDCRAQRILGEWMASIPGKRKHPDLQENFLPQNNLDPAITNPNAPQYEIGYMDFEPQPYIEVLPGEADYEKAKAAADTRVAQFQKSDQYKCLTSADIVDPEILAGGGRMEPLDTSEPPDGVPDLPHWVSTDLSEPRGPWEPRRNDWQAKLLIDDPNHNAAIPELRKPNTTLSAGDFETWAKTPLPMARWKVKNGCDLSRERKLDDFPVGQTYHPLPMGGRSHQPRWLDVAHVKAGEPIFSELPGQAVFDMICVNCHGRQADSRGRQADTIQLLTGGETRVANFRDGLFGPTSNPGANLSAAFSKAATAEVTARDWAARYMAWMALGGTERDIPRVVLNQVGRTEVSGISRTRPLISPSDVSANMLASAKEACVNALPHVSNLPRVGDEGASGYAMAPDQTALIATNGDAELWQRLCAFNNRPILRVIVPQAGPVFSRQLYWADTYPANAKVGDHLGNVVTGVDPATNFFPWCVNPTEKEPGDLAEFLKGRDLEVPMCPPAVLDFTNNVSAEDENIWVTRGAINAGFSVFVFLEALTKGEITVNGVTKPFRAIRYDECQLLETP